MARRGPKPGTIIPRPPHDIITQGRAVGVLLSNRSWRVWVDLADFCGIVEKYGNRSWTWIEAAQYVRIRLSSRTEVPVARLIVGEGGRFIRFRDGDRLNLRRANLKAEDAVRPGGRAKRDATLSNLVVKREAPWNKVAPRTTKRPDPHPVSVLLPPRPVKGMIPQMAVQAVPAIKRSRISRA